MMEYEYGVEYETNGEKPDLPGDVLVHVMFEGWQSCGVVDIWTWEESQKFRIVDERYKPASDTNVGSNWYEKGELPPVGSVITAIDKRKSSGGIKCELKYMGADVCVLYDINDDIEFAVQPCFVDFKPLRTERDALVNSLSEDVLRYYNNYLGVDCDIHEETLAEHLIEQGYRKIKPMSEQEFMKQCLDICGHGDARLYRAGCRFIEQVKV